MIFEDPLPHKITGPCSK